MKNPEVRKIDNCLDKIIEKFDRRDSVYQIALCKTIKEELVIIDRKLMEIERAERVEKFEEIAGISI